MLKVENLNVFYGAIHALHDISFQVNQGEIVTLIGANGAGKTTTLHTISGLLRQKSGVITFKDKNLATVQPHKLVNLGLSQVPEGRRVFAQMSVLENLEMGAYIRNNANEMKNDLEMVFSHFPRLKERVKQLAVLCPAANSRCWP